MKMISSRHYRGIHCVVHNSRMVFGAYSPKFGAHSPWSLRFQGTTPKIPPEGCGAKRRRFLRKCSARRSLCSLIVPLLSWTNGGGCPSESAMLGRTAAERNCLRIKKLYRCEKWYEKREKGSEKQSKTCPKMFKPLSRRLKISHQHFSKSFSSPKICTKKVFLSPGDSAGVATLRQWGGFSAQTDLFGNDCNAPVATSNLRTEEPPVECQHSPSKACSP